MPDLPTMPTFPPFCNYSKTRWFKAFAESALYFIGIIFVPLLFPSIENH